MPIETTVTEENFWPMPMLDIRHSRCEELNAALARIIKEQESAINGKGKSTPIAGFTKGISTHWLEYNVLNWNYPEIAEFRELVFAGLEKYFKVLGAGPGKTFQIVGISCWANVLRYGDCQLVHHHDPAFVSGHYQVQTGYDGEDKYPETTGRRDNGHTVYFRPGFIDRSHGADFAGKNLWDGDWLKSVEPVSGKLFFFPSYVRHEVRPYLGKSERISIAMDVFVKEQGALMYFGGPRWHVPGSARE